MAKSNNSYFHDHQTFQDISSRLSDSALRRQSQELDPYPMISNLTITQPPDPLGLFDLSITDRQTPLTLPPGGVD